MTEWNKELEAIIFKIMENNTNSINNLDKGFNVLIDHIEYLEEKLIDLQRICLKLVQTAMPEHDWERLIEEAQNEQDFWEIISNEEWDLDEEA